MTGYACIGLHNPKHGHNLGAALRAANCYGASMLAYTGGRCDGFKAADTPNGHRHIPLLRPADLFDVLPYDCVPVAVDLVEGAIPLPEYEHPERAFYIFGAEDGTLGRRHLDRCRDVIYVPTNGCMNLAATVSVVLYDRMMKKTMGPRKKS